MKSKMILMAYQDDSWVKPLSTLFAGMGYRIETSRTVSEAFREVRSKDVQVILLDDQLEDIGSDSPRESADD